MISGPGGCGNGLESPGVDACPWTLSGVEAEKRSILVLLATQALISQEGRKTMDNRTNETYSGDIVRLSLS
jgi:hypothetical protein